MDKIPSIIIEGGGGGVGKSERFATFAQKPPNKKISNLRQNGGKCHQFSNTYNL